MFITPCMLLHRLYHYPRQIILKKRTDIRPIPSMTVGDSEKVQSGTFLHIRDQDICVLIPNVWIFWLYSRFRSKRKLLYYISIFHVVGALNEPLYCDRRHGSFDRQGVPYARRYCFWGYQAFCISYPQLLTRLLQNILQLLWLHFLTLSLRHLIKRLCNLFPPCI